MRQKEVLGVTEGGVGCDRRRCWASGLGVSDRRWVLGVRDRRRCWVRQKEVLGVGVEGART